MIKARRWAVAGVCLCSAMVVGCTHRAVKPDAEPPPAADAAAPTDAKKGAGTISDEQRFRDAIELARRLSTPAKTAPPAAPSGHAATPDAPRAASPPPAPASNPAAPAPGAAAQARPNQEDPAPPLPPPP